MLTIALPKIVDEGIAALVPLVLVGSIATAVLVCGALAQLTVGRLVERVPPHVIFAVVTGARLCRQSVGDVRQRRLVDDRAGARHRRDLRPGHGQRHHPRALHGGCLARPRLRRALLHAVRQRRRRDRLDLAVAQRGGFTLVLGVNSDHRAGDVHRHRGARVFGHQY